MRSSPRLATRSASGATGPPSRCTSRSSALADGPATAAFIKDLTEIRAGEEARRDALRDVLTGLPNRRSLSKALGARLQNLRRYGWSFGLLIVDIDHFKSVNDSLGHAAGDEVLRAVAEVMSGHLRRGDILCRWGSEEFVVLVDGARGNEIAAGANVDDSADALFERADRALYLAKEAGRNRVALAEPHGRLSDASSGFRMPACPAHTRAALPLNPAS